MTSTLMSDSVNPDDNVEHTHQPEPSKKKSFYRRTLPSDLIELSSEEGKKRFGRAMQKGQADVFFRLISNSQTQSEPSFCGLTTLAIVLNTLEIDPQRVWKFPWRWYSEDMLECCLTLEQVKKYGLTMDQMGMIGSCEGALVDSHRSSGIEFIRRTIVNAVGEHKSVIVASYDRKVLGQTGSGHFSPIAAYDEHTDSVLVLDVASFKYAPHWVHLPLLMEATSSIDKQSGLPRGFLTFQKPLQSDGSKCNQTDCCGKAPTITLA